MIYPQTPEVIDHDIPDMLLDNVLILEEDELVQITLVWSGPIISGEMDFIQVLN